MGRGDRNTGKHLRPEGARLAPAIVFALLGFLFCVAQASTQESAVGHRVKEFTDSLMAGIAARVPRGSALAIPDFDTKGEAAARQNLGFAVSEIITQELQRAGGFLILEKKQLEQIVKTLELQESGLYDSDKVATIGRLINAQYLLVGSVAELGGFSRVSVRLVEVESGLVLITDSVELDDDLLRSAAEKYQPPKYRLLIGSSMSWFATTPGGLGTYSIGLCLGASWNFAPDQWLSFQTIFHFWHYGFSDSLDEGSLAAGGSFMYSNYRFVDAFIFMVDYSRRYPLGRTVSIQPSLGAGAVIGGLDSSLEYASWPALSSGYTPTQTSSSAIWASPAAQARMDLVFMERSPISFYIGTGWFVYLRRFNEANHDLVSSLLISGIRLEGAIMFYF